MKIAIGCDHGGYLVKEEIKKHLLELNYEVIDEGTNSLDSCHYPIYAQKAAQDLLDHKVERIVLVCTTGEGIMMAANKYKGVRVGIGYDDEVCSLMRRHNNANGIAFGAKFMKLEDILRRIDIFLTTDFEGGRHETRVKLFDEII